MSSPLPSPSLDRPGQAEMTGMDRQTGDLKRRYTCTKYYNILKITKKWGTALNTQRHENLREQLIQQETLKRSKIVSMRGKKGNVGYYYKNWLLFKRIS